MTSEVNINNAIQDRLFISQMLDTVLNDVGIVMAINSSFYWRQIYVL